VRLDLLQEFSRRVNKKLFAEARKQKMDVSMYIEEQGQLELLDSIAMDYLVSGFENY
jgi:hypothetical protein